jgi:glycosyltransferase involved in cell wall biosynthesis
MLVSAAMIVRDEAHHLAACLDSLRGVVDEIVVVDTGSRDDTRAIAVAGGARLLEFPWCDDFSAARNHAIEAARGAWILYIDADERLRPYAREQLALDLESPELVGATVRFHPRSGYTAYREYRLFRRDERIRFSGAFHETIVPALNRLIAAGRRLGASELTIDHIGYDGDQSHKLARNLTLLKKELGNDPERVYLWWHLGTVERDLGHDDAAETAWQEGLRLSRQHHPRSVNAVLCIMELVKTRIERDEDCQALLDEGLAIEPGNWILRWLQARAFRAQRRFEPAIAIFQELAAQDPDQLIEPTAYDRRIFGAGAWAELGYCAFLQARYHDSAAYYGEAERLEPQELEYRAKRVLATARAESSLERDDLEPDAIRPARSDR